MSYRFKEQYRRAKALPLGTYREVNDAETEKYLVLGFPSIGYASANDPTPILATKALQSCVGVFAYNPSAKTVGMMHLMATDTEEKTIAEFLERMTHSWQDKIDLHLVGCFRYKKIKYEQRDVLNYLLKHVDKHAEHIALKTFDINQKPHPICVAIDARDGTLIAGSPLISKGWDSFKFTAADELCGAALQRDIFETALTNARDQATRHGYFYQSKDHRDKHGRLIVREEFCDTQARTGAER